MVLVYVLGGGTFDVSVIEIGDGLIVVLSTSGDNHLGGDDFDDRLTDYLLAEFKASDHIDLSHDEAAVQRVREGAEKAKIELSSSTSTTVNLTPFWEQLPETIPLCWYYVKGQRPLPYDISCLSLFRISTN